RGILGSTDRGLLTSGLLSVYVGRRNKDGLSKLDAKRSARRDLSLFAFREKNAGKTNSRADRTADRGSLRASGDAAEDRAERAAPADKDDRVLTTFSADLAFIIYSAAGIGVAGGQTADDSLGGAVWKDDLFKVDADGARSIHPLGRSDLSDSAFD